MPKILIVDDEEEIVRLIGRYAQREGYETAEASDGSEAVELCKKYDFDLIIMDVMMRDMDGYTAVKKIRLEKDIPVLMLSARGTEYDKLFGFEVGVDDYVTKPFSPKELMARVNVILKRQAKANAALKRKVRPFKTKLCIYFLIYTAVIFGALWLLQSVFLQGFYNHMLIRNTKAAVKEIAESGADTEKTDALALENSLFVYITDREGNLLYSTDPYKSDYAHGGQESHNGSENPYLKEEELAYQKSAYRSLPDGYENFLEELAQSGGPIEKEYDTQYVYGQYLQDDTVLFVGVTLDPVGAAARIIRVQLLIVTGLSLALAVLLAFLIARRFAKPISFLSGQAARLGDDDYHSGSRDGFCAETDRLGEILDRTDQKLREAKSYQRDLLANISHDLRTPLTMIRGYAESIRDFGDEEGQRTEDADIIIQESDRLSALVNEILEYSELQANGSEMETETVNMSELVTKVIAQFEPLFRANGGTVRKEIAPELTVKGNASRLQRAVYNLLDNAIRHTKGSEGIRVALCKKDDCVRFEVSDHGGGIPAEQLPHIWEKYYTYRQRGRQGVSGLGLAIVRQIAALHGGRCGVDTEEGVGSTFWMEV